MKRSELTVGAELYYAKPYDWTHDYEGDRVVVIAVEPHEQRKPNRGRPYAPQQTKTGNGVLVDHHCHSLTSRTVLPLGHLRGPYAATLAGVNQRRAEQSRAREEHRARKDAAATAAAVIVWRARDAGYEATLDTSSLLVQITPETLDRLLTAAADNITAEESDHAAAEKR